MSKFQFFPALEVEINEALKKSIAEDGLKVPIIVDEEGNIIDGHHRKAICLELGLDCPEQVVRGLSEQEKLELSLRLNLLRRQLAAKDKKKIAKKLKSSMPGLSDTKIADLLAVDKSTVGRWLSLKVANATRPSRAENPPNELSELHKEINKLEGEHRKMLEALSSIVELINQQQPEPSEAAVVFGKVRALIDALDFFPKGGNGDVIDNDTVLEMS